MNTPAILIGLAEILEEAAVTPATELAGRRADWDSLAIVCAIALIDEHADVSVSGVELAGCVTVADVLTLIAAAAPAA